MVDLAALDVDGDMSLDSGEIGNTIETMGVDEFKAALEDMDNSDPLVQDAHAYAEGYAYQQQAQEMIAALFSGQPVQGPLSDVIQPIWDAGEKANQIIGDLDADDSSNDLKEGRVSFDPVDTAAREE